MRLEAESPLPDSGPSGRRTSKYEEGSVNAHSARLRKNVAHTRRGGGGGRKIPKTRMAIATARGRNKFLRRPKLGTAERGGWTVRAIFEPRESSADDAFF